MSTNNTKSLVDTTTHIEETLTTTNKEGETKEVKQVTESSSVKENPAENKTNNEDEGDEYPKALSLEEKAELDSRSVFVGNIPQSTSPDEIHQHFQSCGIINRVTILCDKFTGKPKGHAYVEFSDANQIQYAISLNASILKGRELKVTAKRTNFPGYTRARAFRSRGRARGYGYAPRGYRGGSRSRGRRSFKAPY